MSAGTDDSAADVLELEATVDAILGDSYGPEQALKLDGVLARDVWDVLERSGFTAIGTPEEQGGAGGGLVEAAAVVRRAAAWALSAPMDIALLIAPLLRAHAGLEPRPGIVSFAIATKAQVETTADGLTVRLPSVPWAESADSLLLLVHRSDGVAVVEVGRDQYDARPVGADGVAPAAEVVVQGVPDGVVLQECQVAEVGLMLQLATTLKLAGALERVLELTLTYVSEREQFGMKLVEFQSVKQQLALLTAEVVVTTAAADGAIDAFSDSPAHASLAVRSARLRAAQAATTVTTIAHQLHGAIGFTREHPLHLYTRRLWSWRDEHQLEGGLRRQLGAQALSEARPGQYLWRRVIDENGST